MYMAQKGKPGEEMMTNDKLRPVEERFQMLMGNIQAGLGIFSASLVLGWETDGNGKDSASLYAVFDDAPEKPMFIMRVAANGLASLKRTPIALDTNVPEQTTVNT
jgi:hypothetical protein